MLRTRRFIFTKDKVHRCFSINVFNNPKLSTQPNTDPTYDESGIVHYTDTQGINIVRQLGTSITNIFGGKGFDTTVYDNLRTESLKNVEKLLDSNSKISNLRMEFSHAHPELIVHHIYGTLLRKKQHIYVGVDKP